MIKYYAWLDNIYMIDDVICETDHYVITKARGRIKKRTDNSTILDTFEDAKKWLINREVIKLAETLNQADNIKHRIADIENLKSPKGYL